MLTFLTRTPLTPANIIVKIESSSPKEQEASTGRWTFSHISTQSGLFCVWILGVILSLVTGLTNEHGEVKMVATLGRYRIIGKRTMTRADQPILHLAPSHSGFNATAYEIASEFERMTFGWDAENRSVLIRFDDTYTGSNYRIGRNSKNISVPLHIREALGVTEDGNIHRRFRLTYITEEIDGQLVRGFVFSEEDDVTYEDTSPVPSKKK